MKKIAIFHNYLGAIGGGERVALEIARTLKADLITTDVEPAVLKNLGYQDINIISLGRTIKFPPLKQISASLKFMRADFSKKYNFFIFSGEWATFASARHKPNLYYCYTPPRYFYDLKEVNLKKLDFFRRIFAKFWIFWHQKFEKKNFSNIQKIISISEVSQKRVQKFYNRQSEIIYPFIDFQKYYYRPPEDFWLSVNRIYPEKRIELQIEVFRQLPEHKLLIIGGFARGDHALRYYKKIFKNLPENVKIIGIIEEPKLLEFYSRCRGLIATALDEDFGLAPLEAMASGKPVVAVDEGGYRETIINGSTGFLVKPDVQALKDAILKSEESLEKFIEPARERAKNFDIKFFRDKIKRAIS